MMRALILVSLLLLCLDARARTPVQYIDFDLSPVSNSLTQQSVIQSYQDSTGALWFITQEGVNKYTGKSVESYTHSPEVPNSLSSNNTSAITEDQKGNLWISTRGGGLNKYDPISNGFSSIKFSPSDRDTPLENDILSVFTSLKGNIWIGYQDKISVLDPNSIEFQHIIPDARNFPKLGQVKGFTQTADGSIWVGTETAGLVKIDPETLALETTLFSKDHPINERQPLITDVTANDAGEIWITTDEDGVYLFDSYTGKSQNFRHKEADFESISSDKTFYAFVDSSRRTWIGSNIGLNLFVPETGTFIRYTSDNSGLPEDAIFSMYETTDGQFWVGTLYGLATGSENYFIKFDVTRGNLSANSINAFTMTPDGTLWVATDDGLNWLANDSDTFSWINEFTSPGISGRVAMSLLGESSTIWVGTFENGLNKIDLDSGETTVYRHSNFDDQSIGANGVTSILRTESGILLIGTFGGGLGILDESTDTFTNLRHDPSDPSSISSDEVLAIYEDSLGYVWVGTQNGVNRVDTERKVFQRFPSTPGDPHGLPDYMIWSFHEDSDRTLWMGSSGGGLVGWPVIYRRELRPQVDRLPQSASVPSRSIYGIQSDADNFLWLSHNRGITRVSPDRKSASQFGVRDGLQAPEFNMGASYADENGLIYFGGSKGFNVIDNEVFKESSRPPSVAINSIEIMNERQEFEVPFNKLQSLNLGYEDKMISIEFYATDYTDPDAVTYAYKIDGLNPNWTISPDARIVSITTLPPGSYELRLAASNPSGIWNWNAKTLPIYVAPPPWQSPTAYAVYIALAAGLLIAIGLRQQRQTRIAYERQRELEQKVEERTADLQEARLAAETAAKAKADFLATMSHEIRTPMHGMVGMTELLLHTDLTGQQRKFAESAHKSGESLINLVNDILDYSKLEAQKIEIENTRFDLVELLDDVCYLQSEPAARKQLSLYNICNLPYPGTFFGDPTKIRQVVMNLVNNAIKFTDKGYICVQAEIIANRQEGPMKTVQITVKDSGIGMDTETQARVFDAFTQADAGTTRKYGGTGLGLSISRQYIDLLNGSIEIDSQPGVGTSISIGLPLESNQHDKPSPFSGLTATVVTRDNLTALMCTTHLTYLGVNTVAVESANEPIESDIVLLDLSSKNDYSDENDALLNLDPTLGVVITSLSAGAHSQIPSDWSTISAPVSADSLFELIATAAKEKINYIEDESTDAASTDAPNFTVLVAEDVELNQRIASEMLQLSGCKVDLAEDGAEAIRMYKESHYDLILMDCQMPNVDGFAATKEIRIIEDSTFRARTPIVALTAGTGSEVMENCTASGMDDYLAKPFTIEEIQILIKSHLRPTADQISSMTEQAKSGLLTMGREYSEPMEIVNATAIKNIIDVEKRTGNRLITPIVEGFENQANEKVSEMELHLENKDFILLRKAAHAIKSMSANVGAERVRSLAAHIEASADMDDASHISVLVPQITPKVHEYAIFVKQTYRST